MDRGTATDGINKLRVSRVTSYVRCRDAPAIFDANRNYANPSSDYIYRLYTWILSRLFFTTTRRSTRRSNFGKICNDRSRKCCDREHNLKILEKICSIVLVQIDSSLLIILDSGSSHSTGRASERASEQIGERHGLRATLFGHRCQRSDIVGIDLFTIHAENGTAAN